MTRVWLQIYKTILLFIVIILVIALASHVNILHAILLGVLPICVLLLARSFYINRYYLELLETSEEITKLVIYKYDQEFQIYNIRTKDLVVKINQVFYSLRPFYKLQFYEGKKMVYQQPECSQWPVRLMIEAYKEIKRTKKEPAPLPRDLHRVVH